MLQVICHTTLFNTILICNNSVGNVIYSYVRGVIIRPSIFIPVIDVSVPLVWRPVILEGKGDVILISARNPNGWRMITLRIITINGLNKYMFNVE